MLGGLQYIGPLEPYQLVITENPLQEIWHLIDFFTSDETVSTCTPPVDCELIPFICEAVAQAEELRISASQTGEHTLPLLAYYSIHNLTKAMLAVEKSFKPAGYHGLKKVTIPEGIDFLDVSAQVDDGVFAQLLTLNNITPIRDSEISVDCLINRCGYLINEYKCAYGKQSSVIVPKVKADIQLNELEITFEKNNADLDQKWLQLLPNLAEYFNLASQDLGSMTFRLKDGIERGSIANIHKVLAKVLTFSAFTAPNSFLLPVTNPDIYWPQEAYLYALSFILSSLVRYYPEYWYSNVIGNKRNRWVVRKINSIIERVYPNLILNVIYSGGPYKFSSSAF